MRKFFIAGILVLFMTGLGGQKAYAQVNYEPLELKLMRAVEEALNPELKRKREEEEEKRKAEEERERKEEEQKKIEEQKQIEEERKNEAEKNKMIEAGYKIDFFKIYLAASQRFGTPWQILAAVHVVETGQRGDTSVSSYAGAQGPMQFMPGTFAAYAQDGDGDGQANINDVNDAIHTAANHLAANGFAYGDAFSALYSYNHSGSYVNYVLSIARNFGYSG